MAGLFNRPGALPEAQDIAGNVFGFDRAHDLLRKAKTAAEEAIAAQTLARKTISESSP
jgi:hypothetical protein